MLDSLMDRVSENGYLVVGEVYLFHSIIDVINIILQSKVAKYSQFRPQSYIKGDSSWLRGYFFYEKELQELLECHHGMYI
jgi:hypothetical protein